MLLFLSKFFVFNLYRYIKAILFSISFLDIENIFSKIIQQIKKFKKLLKFLNNNILNNFYIKYYFNYFFT